MHFSKETIDDIVRKIGKVIPEDPNLVREELNQKLRATLIATLKNMDLVTREEFDIQARLLAKTRLRIEELQQQVEKLEAALEQGNR
jgi:hypothetical protein